MGPTVEPKNEQAQPNSQRFEHLAAPVLHRVLEMATFGPELSAWKLLFRLAPNICKGMSAADGTTLPNKQNVFVLSAIAGLQDLVARGGPNLRAA